MQEQKLSLPMAILININMMMGSGIFLNTVLLAQSAGAVSFVSYFVGGIMLLPLVVTVATLLQLHPNNGFYGFASKELSLFGGFITTWGYFTAKLASATIMIHTCVLTLQQLIPALATISPYAFDSAILSIFIGLNMFNLRTGTAIQSLFTVGKAIPIIFILCSGLFLLQGNYVTSSHQLWSGIPLILPVSIYAVMGFESACSISSKIENAQKNAPLVILISYALNMFILMSYQFLFYGSLGPALASATSYRDVYPSLIHLLMPSDPLFAAKLGGIFNIAIAVSILGGAYGILFSNAWNLYTLARHNHVIGANRLIQFNRYNIPYFCIIIEGLICIAYLLLSQGKQVVLQQMSSLGVVCTYTLCALALINAQRKNTALSVPTWIPKIGLLNCFILMILCVNGLVKSGPASLLGFILLFIIGTSMYWYQRNRPLGTQQT